MTLPARHKIESDRVKRVRSPAHLNWVRSHSCCVPGCKRMPIEAAHVRSSMAGGIGLKPDDSWVISLCGRDIESEGHHAEQHRIGEPAFAKKYAIDLVELAREFARKSPHRKKLGL